MANRNIFKVLEEPLAGVWSVAGSTDEHPGILFLSGSDLRLKLYLEVTSDGSREYAHPTLSLMKPPLQPTITGRTKAAGIVTLFRCVKSHWNAGLALPGELTQMELTLWPHQAWAGPELIDDKSECFIGLRFKAHGLHNILGTVTIDQVLSKELDLTRRKDWLPEDAASTGEYEAIAWKGPQAEVLRNKKKFTIRLFTQVQHAGSSYRGDVLSTTDSGEIACEGASIDELRGVLSEFEQFLSLFCIGRFRANDISLAKDRRFSKYFLLWQMGRKNKRSKLKRLPHQVPLSLSRNADVAAAAIQKWFVVSEERKLARWLVYDTLSHSGTSTARYLALCQAWEILGRELVDTEKLPAAKFNAACSEAKAAFNRHLGEAVSERLGGLLGAANKPSLTKLVEELLKNLPPDAVAAICNDGSKKFARDVSKVRNKLTHLEHDSKLTIERASRMSIYLTYKLTALFCILEMASLGFPMGGLGSMIANNEVCRTACRPIPTE